ncbi:Methylated-DNA--protein-cysteine methyltransferase [Frankia sp. AiPs1]|uniref:methylated-DNA--[protein]-cysteine S-methyltransferase n=1 Tax=Frankia sp. AiPa1 TaxID=573492 RepID=UPI00202ADF78|nr:methylated-DNA--[protein]-cysteine S-methyltransferase [Frankia sp. AiPa1]MCL9761384.1 methylated-DNA--[protein]-cysteine S-methyltransferase [Frankia sp. AiPa1]
MTTTWDTLTSGSAHGQRTLYTALPSPIGELLLVGVAQPDVPGGLALARLSFVTDHARAARPDAAWCRAREPFTQVSGQLEEYFAGRRQTFDLVPRAAGSEFQERVWQALDTIPFGTTLSYGQLAARIGLGRSDARAVGTAVGANPLLLVRPCHRVIGADGRLRGFAAGLHRKEFLLRHEGALPSRGGAG